MSRSHDTNMNRRSFLGAVAAAAATPWALSWLGGCAPQSIGDDARPLTAPPQLLICDVRYDSAGQPTRFFDGAAAPQNLTLEDDSGALVNVYDLFPRDNCPFAIDDTKRLGADGYSLSTPDRTLAGEAPSGDDALWALNMIPFGVAIDGVLLDPSGPWFDGGPADPNNPFDRACSGWEYDPIHPTVSALVGVPTQLRGHVQPGPGARMGSAGLFHYHGQPRLMLENLRAARATLSDALVVGYSADGYWILDSVAPSDDHKQRVHMFSGYCLRSGQREAHAHTNPSKLPSGAHDGTFVQDWVYDPERKRAQIERTLAEHGSYHGLRRTALSAGDARFEILDHRNGRNARGLALQDAPEDAYVYVITPDWPEIPRWFAHKPAASFRAIIPLDGPAGTGRRSLYDACSEASSEIHQWSGRSPY